MIRHAAAGMRRRAGGPTRREAAERSARGGSACSSFSVVDEQRPRIARAAACEQRPRIGMQPLDPRQCLAAGPWDETAAVRPWLGASAPGGRLRKHLYSFLGPCINSCGAWPQAPLDAGGGVRGCARLVDETARGAARLLRRRQHALRCLAPTPSYAPLAAARVKGESDPFEGGQKLRTSAARVGTRKSRRPPAMDARITCSRRARASSAHDGSNALVATRDALLRV